MEQGNSKTMRNISDAFGGESQAFIKYSYFAKRCREIGANDVAEVFENTARQEMFHAFGHLDLLMNSEDLTPSRCLELAIEGETYEYEVMYPQFKKEAIEEQEFEALKEIDAQISESEEHATQFINVLKSAEKKFNALGKVEKLHAQHYATVLLNEKGE